MTGKLSKATRGLLVSVGAISLGFAGASGAGAQDLKAIQSQIEAMQAQIKALQKQVQDAQAQAAAAQSAVASGSSSDLDLRVKWKGAPELTSADGKKFKFKVRGRLMTDYNGIDQDHRITDEGDISAVELRQARLGVEGVLFYDWKYKFEIDFAGNGVGIRDAYLAYANWLKPVELSEIRVGNQYVYTSLEQVTSRLFVNFMEKAAVTEAFLPSEEADRQIGAAVLLGDENWSFQSGVYGASVGPANEMPGQEDFGKDKLTTSVRGTLAPINREVNGVHQVLHFGASFRHRDAGELRDCGLVVCVDDNLNGLYQYRARGADLHLADRFVDTPQIFDADDMFILEAAFVWGPFSMQGEYAQLEAQIPGNIQAFGFNTDPRLSPTYSGWYADASWFLTGETRNYEAITGMFARPKVKRPVFRGSGGWGAWQIAGRFDLIDLSDQAAAITDCSECGEQETWLFGLNWWLTDYTAIKLNVTQSKITGGNGANPRGTGFNRNNGAEITGVGVRAQVDW